MKKLRRIASVLAAVTLVVAMMGIGALSGAAQENSQQGTDQYQNSDQGNGSADQADGSDRSDSGQDNGSADKADSSGSQDTLCAPEWLQEWHQWWGPEGGWWYFWWYQWCHNSQDGWFRSYDSWDWGPPIMF